MKDEVISRQAAIELIHSLYPSAPIMRMNRKRWEKKYKPYIEAEKALEMLPSAQPEPIKVSVDHTMTEEELKELKQKIADSPVVLLPSAQPEYEPVTAEDFAKTMSENMLYSFMAWYGEALELMERQGFVICKKTM